MEAGPKIWPYSNKYQEETQRGEDHEQLSIFSLSWVRAQENFRLLLTNRHRNETAKVTAVLSPPTALFSSSMHGLSGVMAMSPGQGTLETKITEGPREVCVSQSCFHQSMSEKHPCCNYIQHLSSLYNHRSQNPSRC